MFDIRVSCLAVYHFIMKTESIYLNLKKTSEIAKDEKRHKATYIFKQNSDFVNY